MSEITTAITARQAQIKQLQSDIESLQRAASVLGGGTTARAKAVSQPKPKRSRKAKAKPKTTAKPKQHVWSAAEKRAIGRRMKAYWAKRKKPSATTAASPAEPKAARKRKRKPWSAAAKRAMSKRIKASWAKRRKAKG